MNLNNPLSKLKLYLKPFSLVLGTVFFILACKKESKTFIETTKAKQTVVDYILDLESLYLIQYKFEYNQHYQPTKIYRGERYANTSQLQLIAHAFYSNTATDALPDSILTYNTKGFQTGTIYTKDLKPIAQNNLTDTYEWPERRNALLSTPGGRLALAISGSKVNWAGEGHLGSGSDIKILDNISLINRSSLKDSLRVPAAYSTDGSNKKYREFRIQYNTYGYPVNVGLYDLFNTNFETAKINYREE